VVTVVVVVAKVEHLHQIADRRHVARHVATIVLIHDGIGSLPSAIGGIGGVEKTRFRVRRSGGDGAP
jgi:hypothetical protein